MAARKLDIWDLMAATDRRKGDWLSRQSEEARKDFIPLTAMRWVATIKDGPEAWYMLWMVNERVNNHLFDLSSKHPDLIFRLLASCGLGKSKDHQWLAGPSRKTAGNPAADLLRSAFPEASDAEITLLLERCDRSEFRSFVDDSGIQPKDAQELVKAFDKLFPEKGVVKTRRSR